MPLIRYSPGDIAEADGGECPCGLALPTLGRIEGRSNNVVTLPSGRLFVGFSEIMSDFPKVARYQMIQTNWTPSWLKFLPGQIIPTTWGDILFKSYATRWVGTWV